MKISGAPIGRFVITPRCRVAQGGDMEALEEAFRRLRMRYEHHLEQADEDLLERQDLHLTLSVETDREDGEGET